MKKFYTKAFRIEAIAEVVSDCETELEAKLIVEEKWKAKKLVFTPFNELIMFTSELIPTTGMSGGKEGSS